MFVISKSDNAGQVPREADSTTEIRGRFIRKYPRHHNLCRRRIGQREKVSYSAVSVKASANPAGSLKLLWLSKVA